jgi:hypothetical protein
MKKYNNTDGHKVLFFTAFFAVVILLTVLQPYFESKAYNRLTGAQTTYWDAVWLQLRVQDQPKIKDNN